MKKKRLLLLLLVVINIIIPLVSASPGEILIDNYSFTQANYGYPLKANHPSAGADVSAFGQAITITEEVWITAIQYEMNKTIAPTGNAHIVIYYPTGVYGTNARPNGTIIATSDPFDISTLVAAPSTPQWFNFSSPVHLTPGVYCFAYQNPAAGVNAANYPRIAIDTSGPTHAGNYFYYTAGAWLGGASDLGFTLYGYNVSAPYTYGFSDTYYENGTLCVPPVNVSFTGPGYGGEFNTSGGKVIYFQPEPEQFYWTITDGVSTTSRRIFSLGSENLTVTVPDGLFDTFVFTVRDFTSKLSKGDAYLEAWRIINSTDTLIERRKIDTHNEVPLNLVIGATYTIRVRFYDGSLLTWGTFVPGDTATFTIVLRGVAFTDQAYQVANFIFVEITRTGGTLFTIDYEATKNQTIWANVTIQIRNGAVVNQVSRTNNSFTYNYAGALANTSYVVLVEGVHTLRRTWGYTRIFDATETYPDVPDMETIFPMGDMDTTSLIGWVLTIASGLTFSLVYRRAALLAMGTIGSLVTVFGFTDWSYYLLAFVWFFGIVVYLGSGEKG